ncbi:hypothetical protein [Streptomyces sp. NPDC049915]|uniref:hypothetical protein n=1 Tax=Streptomyces sp. NPDC049915 TaxID=3155510 RepID=UPI00341ACAA9
MRIVIEGASPEFERKLLDLLAAHRDELAVAVDTEWSTERAARYLQTLPAAARRFLEFVVNAKGHADAEALRSEFGSLRGPTIALSRAMPRGVRAGWWPEGTPAPIQPIYDPSNPSWQRAVAYVMDKKVLAVFGEALWAITGHGPGIGPDDIAQLEEERQRDEEERAAREEALTKEFEAVEGEIEDEGEHPATTGWPDDDAPLTPAPGWGPADGAPRALGGNSGGGDK